MNLTKCVIGEKNNYTQTVCCAKGDVPDDRNNVLLGFKDDLPVLKMNLSMSNIKDSSKLTLSNGKESPVKKIVKIEIDPHTGDKFINLNGKRLRMVPESQVPISIKESTQANKINSPAHAEKRKNITVLGKIPPVLTSNLVYLPKYVTTSKPSNITQYPVLKSYSRNSNLSNLSEKSLIKYIHTPLIKVKNPISDTDAKPQLADKNVKLITQDKDNFSTTNKVNVLNKLSYNILPKPAVKVCNQKVASAKMEALDLTKPGAAVEVKCVQTDKQNTVDVNVQVCIPLIKNLVDKEVQTIETPLEAPFDILLDNFDDSLFNLDVPSFSPTVTNSPNYITNLDTSQKNQETFKDPAKKFQEDLRNAFKADDKGNMPIHVGVLKNNIILVKKSAFILSVLKQSIDLPNNYNHTPLQLAIIHNASEYIVQYLLEAGAKIDVTTSDGNNLIHLACEYERIEALKLLAERVDRTSTLNQHNHEGLTPLMICASNGLYECAEILLYFDIEIDKRDQISGRTALFHAAENQDLNMVRLLLTSGANTKVKNFFGTSPHDAMYEVDDMDETIRILILGKSLKRKLQEEKVNSKIKKEDKKIELKTYARLERIADLKVFKHLPIQRR